MAKFLNTTSINFFLEQLVQKSSKNLVLISPYLKINPRLRELIEEKVESGLPVTVVYGKTDISQSEKDWFASQPKIEVRFCKDLHAKCYMNEGNVIISSLNLYEFSQINNKEMGVLLTKGKDTEAFEDALEEAQRLVRTSQVVSFEVKPDPGEPEAETDLLEELDEPEDDSDVTTGTGLLTTSKLAKKHKTTAAKLQEVFVEIGHLEIKNGNPYLTDQGKAAGGQFKKGQYGIFFLWPEEIDIAQTDNSVWSMFKKKK
jgi:hypothetical protein